MMKDRPGAPRLNASAVLVVLAAAAFVFSAAFSALAPCGTWNNVLFGVPMWTEADPAGYYLVSAHELYAFHGRHLYPGHPGLPLQMLLHALQVVYYALAVPRSGGPGFTAFIAKNFAQVFVFSKMLATGLHVMTFLLMYRFALSLLRRERAALLAVLGYATSLPVFFYLSRVSVEPLMVLFFLASFLCAWRSHEEAGRPRRSALWAAAAGAASVAGLATKFHLLWPLPAACFGQLLCGDGLPWKRRGRAPRAALLAFAAAALAALALSSLLMDWRDFFAYWEVGGMDHGTLVSGLAGLIAIQRDVLIAIVRGAAAMPARLWLPGATKSGVYLLCELPMLIVAAVGAVRLFRSGERGGRWFWLAAATAYTVLIWAYRCLGVSHDFHGFHYLFVFTTLAAVLFGAASDALFDRRRWRPAAEAAAMVLWIALIHALTLKGVFDSRLQDAAFFSRVRPFSEALASARGGERVALVGVDPRTAAGLTGLAILRETPPMRSALLDELAGDYVSVDRAELERLTTHPAAGERPVGSVVAMGVVDGAPSAIGPFPPDRWLAATAR